MVNDLNIKTGELNMKDAELNNKDESEEIHSYLITKVDNNDDMALEMVNRYVKLLKSFYNMEKILEEDGLAIDDGRGGVKSHPLNSDMKNVNAQLINLKKDIDKHINEYAEYLESIKDDYDSSELV